MIVAVNVSKSLRAGVPVINAAERSWALSLRKCLLCDSLIAVDHGFVVGYFCIIKAFPDHIDPKRVAFELKPCDPTQTANISGRIGGVPLVGIQKGKYIP